ncbi:Short-chain dehydrogenase/reductase ffsI [Exophiala dermatitidis]
MSNIHPLLLPLWGPGSRLTQGLMRVSSSSSFPHLPSLSAAPARSAGGLRGAVSTYKLNTALEPSRRLPAIFRAVIASSSAFSTGRLYSTIPHTVARRRPQTTLLKQHYSGLGLVHARKATMGGGLIQKTLAEPQTKFTNKTVLVTGANSGLGFEAATKFTALDAKRVILAVRDVSKGEQAKAIIESRTGKKDVLEVWQLDMNSYPSIRDFASRISSDPDGLDIAVLNAGVFMVGYEKSTYGWEETLQVNVLSTALLALYLLPKLRDTARKSRSQSGSFSLLEFVSSRRHEKVALSEEALEKPDHGLLDQFNQATNYNSSKQYQTSKFLLMCVMRKLASLVKDSGSDVVVTAVCPGFCQSNLSRGHQGILADLLRAVLNALVLRTSEEGSRALVSGAAVGPEGHGRFWYDDDLHDLIHPLLSAEKGEPAVDKVWDEIVAALEKDVPETKQLIAELTRSS